MEFAVIQKHPNSTAGGLYFLLADIPQTGRKSTRTAKPMPLTYIDPAIVCFIDILGFKSMVTASGDRLAMARRLDAAFERALEAFGGRDAIRGTPDAEWSVRVFSDCLCAAKPLSHLGVAVTMEAVSIFTREMLTRSFPIRGGIAIGPYAESEILLFSEAQILAYELESQVAKYPRVVLSSDLLKYIDAIDDNEFRWDIKEHIILDTGKIHFVNYMIFHEEDDWQGGSQFYQKMTAILRKMLDKTDVKARVRQKYEWMGSLHNWSLLLTAQVLKLSGSLSEDTVWNFSGYYIDSCPARRRFRPLIALDDGYKQLARNVDGESTFLNNDGLLTYQNNYRKALGNSKTDWLRHWPNLASTVDDEYSAGNEDD